MRLQCGEAEANLTSRQLSHSVNVQARHYEAIVGTKHAASAFRTMEALHQGASKHPAEKQDLESDGAPKRKRKRFTKEKDEIKKYFCSEILGKKTPTLFAGEEFIRHHHISSEERQIRDKVKHVIKHLRNPYY